jgi:hypothetical protein
VKLPPLSFSRFERLLGHLLRVRGMDPDDAMDWIEDHYTVEESNEQHKTR